jgi:hypothetical protein
MRRIDRKYTLGVAADQLLAVASDLDGDTAESQESASPTLADKIGGIGEDLEAISRRLDDEAQFPRKGSKPTERVQAAIRILKLAVATLDAEEDEIRAELERITIELEGLCPVISQIDCDQY